MRECPRSPRSSCWGQRRDLDSFCGPGVHPQKPPKNPRPGDAEGGSPSSMLSGGSPTSTAPEEPSRQEPGLAVSSFLEGEPAAASFPGPLEKETALLSASQFARPRKSVGRKAERRVEDLESKAVSPEAMHSPGAPELEGSPGPGAQMPADSSQPTWSGWKPGSPVSEEGAAAYSPKTAGQDPGKEQGASVLDSGDRGSPVPEGAQGLGGPEGQLPCSGAEGTKLDHGDTQEAGALPGTLGGGVGISSTPVPTPSLATLCMKAWASTPRGAGGQAGAPLGTTVTADTGTDATRTDPGALGMAQPPACPREQTPPGCRSVCEETPGGQGEAGPEEQPPRDSPGSPTVLQAAVPGNPEPAVDAQDPAPDLGPSSDHTQAPGPAVEWAGTAQLEDRWAVESDGQHLGGSCVGSSAATKGPFQEARVCQGGLEAPTPPPDPCQHPLDLADQAGWPETLAMELDFLPDSQLQAALDAPGLETPAEQEHPAGNESVLCWPSLGTSRGDRVPETEAQPRMEDASDTVRGLIVELSNLNRLIMSAHRDLETFRRLGPRKARPASCPAKAAMAHDERPRRDL
ncbi:break repair meiotic recombinase recruitment factor 1 isoform X3 [Cavia porcellus]|uniref:break repair meiotic recombinase recruitment factor 1 isoform X3 n=1 Tax=Cavia porcellus TaxID=10141 RepID=UPI000661DA80